MMSDSVRTFGRRCIMIPSLCNGSGSSRPPTLFSIDGLDRGLYLTRVARPILRLKFSQGGDGPASSWTHVSQGPDGKAACPEILERLYQDGNSRRATDPPQRLDRGVAHGRVGVHRGRGQGGDGIHGLRSDGTEAAGRRPTDPAV